MAIRFEAREAAHLLRRATSKGTQYEVQKLVTLGLEGAVDFLLRDPQSAPEYKTFFSRGERGKQLPEIISLWLTHWLSSSTPTSERLTFFWHNHFTSEFRETKGAQGIDFWKQFELFRNFGYGPFSDLLVGVAKNSTMLQYLNNDKSKKEHPNENWARELLELYTTGPDHYTERDIRESARAFTGWTVELPGNAKPKTLEAHIPFEFIFRPKWHDNLIKNFMGKNIQTGEEVLQILSAHPATYLFLATKLLKFYLSPNPPAEMVAEAAQIYQKQNTKAVLRWLFMHPSFYLEQNRNALVKSPTEYLVGLFAAADRNNIALDIGPENSQRKLFRTLEAMGQVPFDPPNVKGWTGGMSWLAESQLLTRLNLLAEFSDVGQALDLSVFMDGAEGVLSLVKPEAQLM